MWEVGGTVALGTQIKDTAGTLVSGGTVVATITLPDGSTATPTVSNPSTGVYTTTYVPAVPGHFAVRWTSTSPVTAYTDSFNVQESAPPLILSLDEARDYLNIPATETVNDEELRGFIEAATPLVEAEVGPVVRRTVTATFYPGFVPVLPQRPVISLASAVLVSTGATVDITNLVYVESGGYLRSKTYSPLPFEPWTITYVVGRPIIPAAIREAAGEVVKNLWSSQRGAGGRRAGQEGAPPFVLSYRAKDALRPYAQSGTA